MIKVGCSGFRVSRKKYREALRLVEVNSTFYKYPRLSTVARWRKEAPEGFEYTVKSHQEISHKTRMVLEQAREPFDKMKEICHTLGSEVLLIQTPASFKPDRLEVAGKFFEETDRDGLTLVWETRGPLWQKTEARERLRALLDELDIPHVTDPFKTMPVYTGQVAYFRLHGLGERMYYYQYTNRELLELHKLVKPFDAADNAVYVLFNNLSMFADAKRFLSFIEDGRFPPLTREVGLESVRAAITKTRYPSSKSMLIRKLGWKLVELEDGTQLRLAAILGDLPSKTYEKPEDVLREVRL